MQWSFSDIGSYDPPSIISNLESNNTLGSILGERNTPEVLDDIHATCKAFKHAMFKTVSSKIIHNPECNSVNLAQFGYLYGEVKWIVTKLLHHRDFDSNTDRSKIVENRAAKDKVFARVVGGISLDDAVIKHGCKLSECSENCTFGKRRALVYVQQAIFALEIARSRKMFTAK